jgi:5'-methylthioadenosine phosphorylase
MKLAIIGGSGLEKLEIFTDRHSYETETPFGLPSSPLLEGRINGLEVVFLSRHGYQHTITPTGINNRANISALQQAGCTHIIATTACGSLRHEIGRGHLVIPDQFIDFTRLRNLTFYDAFEPGCMKHTPMANPFDEFLRNAIIQCAREMDLPVHPRGTVITIEGPRFSTRAESNVFRMWGADIVNMSIAPECILANEAEIPYAAIALSTDYDCWNTDEEPVSWEAVIEIFNNNVHHVTELLRKVSECFIA